MDNVKISFGCALVLLAAGLLCTWPAQAMAQTTEPPSEEVDGEDAQAPSTANPPRYIGGLLKPEGLQQAQVDQMRADGWGWGEIRIAALLAQQTATNGTKESFDAALGQITAARAEGKGFGEIAGDNNLKVGQLVGNKKAGVGSASESTADDGDKASAVDGEDAQAPSTANPPRYIGGLLKPEGLQQAQVDQMRADGWGWGEIRIAALLAQQTATDGTKESFDAALGQITAARAEGRGFGEIAADNNLKVGQLVGNKKAGIGSDNGSPAKAKKPGFFARLGKALGFGRSADKPAKPAMVEKSSRSVKAVHMDKPERSVRSERVKPEKPVRLEKPSRPEKPEKPGPHGR